MLQMRLFGRGQARYSNSILTGFPSQQAYLVLCYLLLNRQHACHREQLAAVFWGEYPTPTSRKYLRNALWRLRNGLQSAGAHADEYLSVTDDSVAFLPSSRYWLDVEVFENTVECYRDLAGSELKPERAADLEKALDLCTGSLLETVYEDWCLYERERLSLMHLNVLSKLMDFHGVNGTYEHGLAYGERILAQDNTREKVHRQMMWLYWLLGDRSAALAQYKLCTQILRDVLGVAPMKETTHLYREIRRGACVPANWTPSHNLFPPQSKPDEPDRLLTEQTLQRVHRLQAAIEVISAELCHLESQLSKALLDAQYVCPPPSPGT
jgi:DNA-binding SARP family transcriptional activator